MANLIPIMGIAAETDADGDLVPVADATAYFYEAGSTTPLTAYTDSSLTTPLGASVAADSDGIFPQCWTAQALIKIDVKDGDGVSLAGFPQDNYPTIAVGGTTAENITVTPVTGNTATDMQAAHANNVGRINTLDNASRLPTSTGSGGTYALTSTYSITAYAAGQEYEFVANHASVGSGSDTLNVDTVGAAVIKKFSGSTTKTDLSAGDIAIGDVVRVKHDGTHFVVSGNTQKLTLLDEDNMASDSATAAPSQQSTKAYVDTQVATKALTEGTKQATTSGSSVSFTVPAGTQEIVLGFNGVSTNGTGALLVVLGDSGGLETTGYLSASSDNGGITASTTAFSIRHTTAGDALSGRFELTLTEASSNTWSSSHGMYRNGTGGANGGGIKALTEALTTIEVQTSNTFDAGEVTFLYR